MPRSFVHPAHPLVAHFPVAFWLGASVSDLVALRTGRAVWWTVSHHAMAAGVIMGTIALLVGGVELALRTLPAAAWRWAGAHALVMATALVLFLMSLSWRGVTPPPVAAVWVAFLGSVLVLVGGYCGGTLVYRYGVGVSWRASERE